MANTIEWKKVILIGALLLAPLALAGCGTTTEQMSSKHTVGPVGPTWPNRYYFDMTASSIVTTPSGFILVEVRVWDVNGNAVGGATAYFSGDFQAKGDAVPASTSGADGIAGLGVQLKDSIGVVHITAHLENLTLTIPIQVISSGQ